MSKLEYLDFLKFLSKPHFVRDVAEQYRISKKLANFHLREAIKSGQVLISEKPVFQTLRSSEGKLRRFRGFLYISQSSHMLVDGWAKFKTREANDLISKVKGDVFFIRFVSKTHGSLGKEIFNHKLSGFTHIEKAEGSRALGRHFKIKDPLASEFDVSLGKLKLANHRTIDQLLEQEPCSTEENFKSLSHVERMHLFQALSAKPLPFLDLHKHFGVSKQTIRRLVKNGLLAEMWGPRTIGVRFKLTDKGKLHLKGLKKAAAIKPEIKKNAVIKLKQRIML
jgi:hypothetical protein